MSSSISVNEIIDTNVTPTIKKAILSKMMESDVIVDSLFSVIMNCNDPKLVKACMKASFLVEDNTNNIQTEIKKGLETLSIMTDTTETDSWSSVTKKTCENWPEVAPKKSTWVYPPLDSDAFILENDESFPAFSYKIYIPGDYHLEDKKDKITFSKLVRKNFSIQRIYLGDVFNTEDGEGETLLTLQDRNLDQLNAGFRTISANNYNRFHYAMREYKR
jgi:hypothetical protein